MFFVTGGWAARRNKPVLSHLTNTSLKGERERERIGREVGGRREGGYKGRG